ncbi:MAG: cupredoxin domain-containing protein [Acidimicrobiia bacterium]
MHQPMSRTIRLLLAASLAGIALFAATPAEAARQAVDMIEGNSDDANSWDFAPADITLKAGTTILWTNKGVQPHTASANDGSFDSGTMKSGATWEHRFDTPGEFPYVCAFHPQMTGMVRVTP